MLCATHMTLLELRSLHFESQSSLDHNDSVHNLRLLLSAVAGTKSHAWFKLLTPHKALKGAPLHQWPPQNREQDAIPTQPAKQFWHPKPSVHVKNKECTLWLLGGQGRHNQARTVVETKSYFGQLYLRGLELAYGYNCGLVLTTLDLQA